MFHFTYGPALVVEAGMAVFCFIDLLRAPEEATRLVPRWAWVLGLLVVPSVGSVAWLVAGRHRRARLRGAANDPAPPPDPAMDRPGTMRSKPILLGTLDPADRPPRESRTGRRVADGLISAWPPDPGLAGELWEINEEHERTLRLWEADLRRREQQLRASGADWKLGATGDVDVA